MLGLQDPDGDRELRSYRWTSVARVAQPYRGLWYANGANSHFWRALNVLQVG